MRVDQKTNKNFKLYLFLSVQVCVVSLGVRPPRSVLHVAEDLICGAHSAEKLHLRNK